MYIKTAITKGKAAWLLKDIAADTAYGFLCGCLFYRSLPVTVLMASYFGAVGYARGKKRERTERRNEDEDHFYEFLIELAEGLDSGNNIVNMIRGAYDILPEGNVRAGICEAVNRLDLNYSMEEAFMLFSDSIDSSLIKSWTRIITISYENGADLQKAIRENRDLFILKRRTRHEVTAIMARQRFNMLVIKFLPFVIILILLGSSGGFSEALYSPSGRIVMTVSLVLIFLSEWIAGKIAGV